MSLSLKTYLNLDYLHLVTSFTEESAKIFHLEKADSLKLILACEEVFSYLCQAGNNGEQIDIEIADGIYYVQLKFPLKGKNLNLKKFNLTATGSSGDESSLDDMGLLIASRSVERFYIASDNAENLQLVLIKEKTYPAEHNPVVPGTKALENPAIKTPDKEYLKELVHQIVANYKPVYYLQDFHYAGKVADMVGSGEYGVKIIQDKYGTVGGGIIWRGAGSKTVEIFGPYVFNQPSELKLAEGLVDACISEVSKTQAIELISRFQSPELPADYFELLGTIEYVQPDGIVQPRRVYYRQLKEDPGCRVWVNKDIETFLRAEYKRLFFMREIATTRYEGEQRSPNSVFAYQFDRRNNEVTLKPIWDGDDFAENLAQHINVLKAESIKNIFFEIDLARAWQVNMTQALIKTGLKAVLLLPYGGDADTIVFQYQGGA